MRRRHWIDGVLLGVALSCTTHAHAHFKLLKPASWLNEDDLGSPQKGSPCGPGNTRPFIGDDKQPIPASDAVTAFHAGETITVEWQETVYHPGYFRISLAPTSAGSATSTDFPDPPLTDTENCQYDQAAVQTGSHDGVLADGLYRVDDMNGTARPSLTQDVTLPDQPCDHCTLQVVQVMEGHPAASCFYFHCANLTILPVDGGSPVAGGASDAGTGMGSHKRRGGCAVAEAGAQSSTSAAWCLLGIASAFCVRRMRRRIC